MKWMKRATAFLLAGAMCLGVTACSGDPPASNSTPSTAGNSQPVESEQPQQAKGTIMWLANLSSGLQYDTMVNYTGAICEAMGYDLTVVYADPANDAAGNLNAVRNGMTDDVVGLIASQDGGIAAIMEEFPDLYVCGYNTDMRSVYGEGGENAACLTNDHFLGTICDGYANGEQLGLDYANAVIEKGYTKVAVVKFPVYAYPNQTEAEASFLAAIEEHNATADTPVEVVGETTTLEFQPMADSFFLEEGRDDLDAVVSLCNGFLFVYPTMVTAKANGTCAADTKLLTGGFENDESILSDIGDDGTISWIEFSPAENPAYAMVLLDNAITGNQFADFEAAQVSGAPYIIDSTADIQNVMSKSMAGTGDVSLAQLPVDQVLQLCVRFNPDATYQGLLDTMHSEQLSVDVLQ